MSNDKQLAEDYKKWRRNVSFLYNFVLSHVLEWPSLSIEWTGAIEAASHENVNLHECLFAPRSMEKSRSTINVAKVHIPETGKCFQYWGEKEGSLVRKNDIKIMPHKQFGIYHPVTKKIEIKRKIVMRDFVSNVKAMPQSTSILASTVLSSKEVFIFNHISNRSCDKSFTPDNVLKMSTEVDTLITSLDWNCVDAAKLATCSNKSVIAVYDSDVHDSEPITEFVLNSNACATFCKPVDYTDLKWHRSVPSVVISTSKDGKFRVFDIRSSDKSKPSHEVFAHLDEVTSLSFSDHDDVLFVTSSKDKTIALWDLRNLSVKIHSFTEHANSVEKVSWCPHDGNIIASRDSDRSINWWDLSAIGRDKDRGVDTADSCLPSSELLFSHKGHSSPVTDFSWCPNEPYLIGSVSEDNISQFWIPTEQIFQNK